MRLIPFRHIVSAALLGAALSACADSPNEPKRDPREGTLSFTFQGSTSGTYQAQGIPPAGRVVSGTYATAYVDEEGYFLSSFRTINGTRGDRLVLLLDGPAGTGTFRTSTCTDDAQSRCLAYGAVVFDMEPGLNTDPQRVTYANMDGTVTIQSVEGGRLKGTFSGTATASQGRTITIQNGSFDVAILNAP